MSESLKVYDRNTFDLSDEVEQQHLMLTVACPMFFINSQEILSLCSMEGLDISEGRRERYVNEEEAELGMVSQSLNSEARR